ncbi:hypothetical protein DT076_02775 [Desertihabitans brevis]|uniref:PF03932 family protein CutC n=1 Tax=Desertihabitans brevis TaxID=2268447 RepID=A0A367YZU0_9ACTN|nr:copper homeostasis protein CutC [Desertihabitans brevis]RCK71364.1 hypothetical protein DT076_02775 [Desertihabitans brevis]
MTTTANRVPDVPEAERVTAVELAVQDPAGIAVAAAVGADRLELCTALALGGMTPSAGLVETAVASGVPTHVLVRPRGGAFDYTAEEVRLVRTDVRRAVAAGAAGVVVGGVRAGAVDTELVRSVVECAAGAEVTFHRAFDVLADPDGALEQLAALGVHRVLTSAGAARAADALPGLERLVRRSDGRVQVMAGGGVDPSNAARVAATGVAAVHASAKRTVREDVAVPLGSAAPAGESGYDVTDEALARGIVAAVRGERG